MEALQTRIQMLEVTVGGLMDILRSHNMLPQCPMEPVVPMSPVKEKTVEAPSCPTYPSVPGAPIKKSREEALVAAKQRALEKAQMKAKEVQEAICAEVPKVERSISGSSISSSVPSSSSSVSGSESDNEDGKKAYKKIPGKICGARVEGEAVEIPGTKSSRSGKPIQAYKPKECGRSAAFAVKIGEDEDDVCYLCAVCHTRYSEDKDTWLGFFDDGAIPPKSHLMGSAWYKAVLAEGMKKLVAEVPKEGMKADA